MKLTRRLENTKLTTQSGLNKMIETDTNVHLFLHEDSMRQLIIKKMMYSN